VLKEDFCWYKLTGSSLSIASELVDVILLKSLLGSRMMPHESGSNNTRPAGEEEKQV
jgi:hypothetical protein